MLCYNNPKKIIIIKYYLYKIIIIKILFSIIGSKPYCNNNNFKKIDHNVKAELLKSIKETNK